MVLCELGAFFEVSLLDHRDTDEEEKECDGDGSDDGPEGACSHGEREDKESSPEEEFAEIVGVSRVGPEAGIEDGLWGVVGEDKVAELSVGFCFEPDGGEGDDGGEDVVGGECLWALGEGGVECEAAAIHEEGGEQVDADEADGPIGATVFRAEVNVAPVFVVEPAPAA